MGSTQLTFTLSTSPKFDAVHLVGSWDNYKQRLPLSGKKAGSWKGTFKFPSTAVKPGSRYWYYVSAYPFPSRTSTLTIPTVHH